ncbi:MAG TPA: hypothetical protein VFF79_12575 [Conexibacter sp.]|nr:hypothetical protein [Conexibacter sp.]
MSATILQFPQRHVDGKVWEPWIGEREIARHYGNVSTRTVRRWRLAGMPSRLIGGQRMFRISETERWHAERNRA